MRTRLDIAVSTSTATFKRCQHYRHDTKKIHRGCHHDCHVAFVQFTDETYNEEQIRYLKF